MNTTGFRPGGEERLQVLQRRRHVGHQRTLSAVEADFENIRAAWKWAVERGDMASVATASNSLRLFCGRHSHYEERGLSFKEAVNQTLRRGLYHLEKPPGHEPYRLKTFDMGESYGALDDIGEVLAVAEGEDYR